MKYEDETWTSRLSPGNAKVVRRRRDIFHGANTPKERYLMIRNWLKRHRETSLGCNSRNGPLQPSPGDG